MKQIKITQIKSAIGYRERTKQTLTALGLKKMNQSVLKNVSDPILGIVKTVSHLVKVEEVK